MPLWSKLWSAKFGFLKIKHKMRKTSHFTVKYTKIPHFFKCGIGGGRWIREPRGFSRDDTLCYEERRRWIRFAAAKPRADGQSTGLSVWAALLNPPSKAKTANIIRCSLFLVGEGGFEPPKAVPADLQSVPFGHSGIPPYEVRLLSMLWSW